MVWHPSIDKMMTNQIYKIYLFILLQQLWWFCFPIFPSYVWFCSRRADVQHHKYGLTHFHITYTKQQKNHSDNRDLSSANEGEKEFDSIEYGAFSRNNQTKSNFSAVNFSADCIHSNVVENHAYISNIPVPYYFPSRILIAPSHMHAVVVACTAPSCCGATTIFIHLSFFGFSFDSLFC